MLDKLPKFKYPTIHRTMIEMCVFSKSETSFGHDMLCGPFKEGCKISFSMLIAKQFVIYKFISDSF